MKRMRPRLAFGLPLPRVVRRLQLARILLWLVFHLAMLPAFDYTSSLGPLRFFPGGLFWPVLGCVGCDGGVDGAGGGDGLGCVVYPTMAFACLNLAIC